MTKIIYWSVWLCGMITGALGIISGNEMHYGIGLGIIFGLIIAQVIDLRGDSK